MNEHLLCEDCGELVDECLCEEMLDQLEEDDEMIDQMESDEEDVYEELLVDVEEQVDDDMMGKKEEV